MAPPTLSLKQRLAALATAPSTRTNSPTSPSPRNLQFPALRSPNHEFGVLHAEEQYEGMRAEDRDVIDKAVSGVITQAGVDYETRPMVVVTAASFPDPRQISYDILLSRIIAYLDLYVENDYVVVFLAAGGRHTPSWNWVWKAYRGLSRKYRKNLKRLLIVHPTWFSKMFVSMAGAVISPKFFRKITYVSTLSELARHVPLTQIDVAPAVYNENLKHERTITLPNASPSSLTFGVPLEQLMGPDGESSPLPRVVRDCVEYLRSNGPLGLNLEVEGLFRRSPNGAVLRSVKEAYDRGHQVSIAHYADPHIAAVLLKKFLRDLPEPIFTGALYPIIARCPPSTGWGVDGLSPDPRTISLLTPTTPGRTGQTLSPNGSSKLSVRAEKGHARVGSEAELATVGGWGEGDACVEYIREVVLPAMGWGCRVVLLGHIFHLLHDVSLRSASNKMDAHNLALCIAPNLVRSKDPIRDVKICTVPPSAGALQMLSGTGQQPWGPGTGGAGWNSPGSGAGGAGPVPPRQAGTTTLGEIVKVCIERYFEIFEDVPDRGDALPVPSELSFETTAGSGMGLSGLSPSVSDSGTSLSGSARMAESNGSMESSVSTLESVPRSSVDIEDDELNEAMLVMSVVPEPTPPSVRTPTWTPPARSASMDVSASTSASRGTTPLVKSTGALGPSAWSRSPKLGASASTPALSLSPGSPSVPLGSPASPTTPLPRHRRTPSSSSTTFSTPYTTGQGSASGAATTIRGARSVISIEKKPGGRKGSIALGRTGAGGSSASPVAAMGVTATGFFERSS